MRSLVRFLPVGSIAQLRSRSVVVDRVVTEVARLMADREGTIASGVGAGLRFDATGGYPGYLLGTSEPAEQALLASVLRPGATFYDVGANIGFFAVLGARLVGPEGRVVAFEPLPASAQATRANAARNGFAHLDVVEAAVSDRSGAMVLDVERGSAEHRLVDSGEGLEVAVVSVDGWRSADAGRPAPTLVMIDVEGAEIQALRGMATLLREHGPTIVCEVHWLGERFLEFVRTDLEPLGYRLRALSGEIPSGEERWHAVLERQ